MNIAYLDKDGNVRPPSTWREVKESICDQWDSCSPCTYRGAISRTHGGWECRHPLSPQLGIINNTMTHLVDDIEKALDKAEAGK